MSDFGNNNSNSKPKLPKFISFSLLIYQNILNDIQLCLRGYKILSLTKRSKQKLSNSWCKNMMNNIMKVANRNQLSDALISLITLLP